MQFMIRESVADMRSLDTLNDNPFKVRTEYDTSGRARLEMRMYNGTGAACVVGQVLKVKYQLPASSGNPQLVVLASGSAAVDEIAVALNATASGAWDWFCVGGYCNALVTSGGTTAAGDSLLVKAGASTTALQQDQSGGAMTVNTVAFAQAAGPASGAAALTAIFIPMFRATFTQ